MTASLSVAAARPLVKHPAESLLLGIDFRRLLAAGEILATPVTVTAEPAGLVLSMVQINTTPFADPLGGTVPAGAGVQVRIAGGASPLNYELTVTAATSLGNLRAGVCVLQVRSN